MQGSIILCMYAVNFKWPNPVLRCNVQAANSIFIFRCNCIFIVCHYIPNFANIQVHVTKKTLPELVWCRRRLVVISVRPCVKRLPWHSSSNVSTKVRRSGQIRHWRNCKPFRLNLGVGTECVPSPVSYSLMENNRPLWPMVGITGPGRGGLLLLQLGRGLRHSKSLLQHIAYELRVHDAVKRLRLSATVCRDRWPCAGNCGHNQR